MPIWSYAAQENKNNKERKNVFLFQQKLLYITILKQFLSYKNLFLQIHILKKKFRYVFLENYAIIKEFLAKIGKGFEAVKNKDIVLQSWLSCYKMRNGKSATVQLH